MALRDGEGDQAMMPMPATTHAIMPIKLTAMRSFSIPEHVVVRSLSLRISGRFGGDFADGS